MVGRPAEPPRPARLGAVVLRCGQPAVRGENRLRLHDPARCRIPRTLATPHWSGSIIGSGHDSIAVPVTVAGFEPAGRLIVQDEPERIPILRGIDSHTLSTPALVEVKTHMLAKPLLLEPQPISPITDRLPPLTW